MAKDYLVLVETQDWINVDADSIDEAMEKAKEIASHDLTHDWNASVIGVSECVE